MSPGERRVAPPSSHLPWSIALSAILLVTLSVVPQFHRNTWIFRDGRFYVNVLATLTEDGTLDQHRFASSWYDGKLGWNANLDAGWSNVALGAHGEYFPKHPWLHPLLAAPLFYAFGLTATLAQNVLLFGLIAAGLYRYARARSDPEAAALSVSLFVFATVIVQSAYDFSVDVLLLACFVQGLAAVVSMKSNRAGVLFGIATVLKPTTILFALPTGVLLPKRAAVARALAAGAIVLALFAAANTLMYGRPWWSGYNRTLVTRNGHPEVADHLNAFSVPLVQGFTRVMQGDYGLEHAFPIVCIAVVGLLWLLARNAREAWIAVIGVTASLLVFSKYEYEGHRFHWPALSLLVLPMAVSFEALRKLLASLRVRRYAFSVLVTIAALLAGCAIRRSSTLEEWFSLALCSVLGGVLATSARRFLPSPTAAFLVVGAIAVGLAHGLVADGAWLHVAAITTVGFALLLPVAWMIDRMARACARVRLDGRQFAGSCALMLVSLLMIGVVRERVEAAEPFRAATDRAIRRARVYLGDIPCDFLAWEHMSWECSHFDVGLTGMVGLARSGAGIPVGGTNHELILLPSGRSGQTRSIAWQSVSLSSALEITYAVPDDASGGGALDVSIDGRPGVHLVVPERPTHELLRTRISTPAHVADVEIRYTPQPGRPGRLAFDLRVDQPLDASRASEH